MVLPSPHRLAGLRSVQQVGREKVVGFVDPLRRPADEPQTLDAASRQLGIAVAISEKDYWVCRTLDALFNLPDLGDHLVFKGGTSLSKAYSLIERFSEDVDVSFHRDYLGFADTEDLEAQEGNKAKDRKIGDLQAACVAKIASS